jgi:hypothetical protein
MAPASEGICRMISFTPGQIRTYWAARAKLRKVGAELRGPCPIHKGKRDSFAVNIETGQACCHSECGGQGWDIVGFEQLYSACDFQAALVNIEAILGTSLSDANASGTPTKQRASGDNRAPKKLAVDVRAELANSGFRPAQEFYYRDGLRKVRFEHSSKIQVDKQRPEKTYRWEHRGADGIWYSGAGPGPKPMYANSVFANRDQAGLAIGFEGEAKADLAGELGFAAFSFKDISEAAAADLIDWEVVLWPDADPAGFNSCRKAAELIAKAGARSVAIAHPPPDIPNAGDIIDAVRVLGCKAEDVKRLIAGAHVVRSAKPKGIQSISEVPPIEGFGSTQIKYLIQDVVPEATIVLLTGGFGCGKSSLTSRWAGDLAAVGRPVLILDRENPISAVRSRFQRLGITSGPLLRYWGGWLPDAAPQLNSPIVLDWVKACDPKPLIVVDSFTAFLRGDENDAQIVRAWFDGAVRPLVHAGATVIVLHNDGKSETARDFRGSSAIGDAVDVGYHVTNTSSNHPCLENLRLRPYKLRVGKPEDGGTFSYNDGQFSRDSEMRAAVQTAPERLTDLLRASPGILGPAFEKLATQRGLGRNPARKFLSNGIASMPPTIRRECGHRKDSWRHYLIEPE